ncbi:MAG: DegT/DnrJ/EryC1/StrS aminotransferase family protein [Myxococcales bacterium]|nr:DegT/DnrJ/EryC1/StrS aminotransferase family protein [Myxococcales bacterium]
MPGVQLAERLGWGPRTRFTCEGAECGAGQFIPFGVPAIGRAERRAVDQTLASRWIGTGPQVARFEAEFADAVGASHAVAVSSCTAALHLALLTHGIGPGDEVITTPMSFVATANAILYTGAEPVFADIDDTLNLDPAAVAKQVTSRTRAILAVHFGGAPCDVSALGEIAKRHGLGLIEDAAHAIGSCFGDGRRVGSSGNDTCFSFYPNKNITTCEGGMVTTEDAARAEQLRSLRLHGLSTDAWKRFGSRSLVRSRMLALGFKYNMTDLQAALGRAQLTRLEAFTELRNRQAHRYRAAFADCQHFAALPALASGRSAYHLFTLWVRGLVRDEVIEELRRAGVGASIHYHPIHLQPYYRERDPSLAGRFPAAERAGAETLSLPVGPSVRPADQERIIRAVREIDCRHRVARLHSARRVRAAPSARDASVRELSEPGP